MKFEYQALDEDGKIVKGIMKASDIKKVFRILVRKQWTPMDIRPLTDTTVEIDRLNQLRMKLEGKEVQEEPIQPRMEEPPKPRTASKFDWSYILFLLMVIGLIAAMVVTQGLV